LTKIKTPWQNLAGFRRLGAGPVTFVVKFRSREALTDLQAPSTFLSKIAYMRITGLASWACKKFAGLTIFAGSILAFFPT
jgi:hypothetical protein